MDPTRSRSPDAADPDEVRDLILDGPEELDEGRFSLVCPRHGVRAEVHIEGVSGSVRSFTCSVPGDDDPDRRRCQAACARWLLGEVG